MQQSHNQSYNAFKSSLWPASKAHRSAFGLSSVTLITSSKACLPPVSGLFLLSSTLSCAGANVFTEANHVVHEGKLKKGCFVRLKSYQANQVKGKR